MCENFFLLFKYVIDSPRNKVRADSVALEGVCIDGFVTPQTTRGMSKVRKRQTSFQQTLAA